MMSNWIAFVTIILLAFSPAIATMIAILFVEIDHNSPWNAVPWMLFFTVPAGVVVLFVWALWAGGSGLLNLVFVEHSIFKNLYGQCEINECTDDREDLRVMVMGLTKDVEHLKGDK